MSRRSRTRHSGQFRMRIADRITRDRAVANVAKRSATLQAIVNGSEAGWFVTSDEAGVKSHGHNPSAATITAVRQA